MEEKNLQQKQKPGIADAIHPEIGNGALFEENIHAFLLRMPDPTKSLEFRLKDEVIVSHSDIPPVVEEKAQTKPDSLPGESVSVKLKDSKLDDNSQVNEKSPVESDSIASTKKPVAVPSIGKKRTVRKKAEVTSDKEIVPEVKKDVSSPQKAVKKAVSTGGKVTKPGKLIRKAAKSEERKLKGKRPPKLSKAKKTAKKAPEKVSPVKPVARKTVRKTVAEKPAVTTPQRLVSKPQSAAKATQIPLELELSPFIQWLKSLRGTDYVHPYDDDFALHQGLGDNQEGISETYADLLASQGHKEQAIEMYIRLIEKYPEKSSFFAAKIEGLQ